MNALHEVKKMLENKVEPGAILAWINSTGEPSGVFAVTTDYGIKYHTTDLSNVIKPDEALFIGTGYECACFIRDHKPSQPSGGKSAEEMLIEKVGDFWWICGKHKPEFLSAMEEYANQYAHQQPVQGYKAIVDGVVHYFIQQPVNDGWVRVEDALPEQYTTCLVIDAEDVDMAIYLPDNRWEDKCHEGLNHVTHWRPLPEPPKQ